jgi:hypothetical protein
MNMSSEWGEDSIKQRWKNDLFNKIICIIFNNLIIFTKIYTVLFFHVSFFNAFETEINWSNLFVLNKILLSNMSWSFQHLLCSFAQIPDFIFDVFNVHFNEWLDADFRVKVIPSDKKMIKFKYEFNIRNDFKINCNMIIINIKFFSFLVSFLLEVFLSFEEYHDWFRTFLKQKNYSSVLQ